MEEGCSLSILNDVPGPHLEKARIWWTERGGVLRSQIGTLKRGQHIKYRLYAFREYRNRIRNGILGINGFKKSLM